MPVPVPVDALESSLDEAPPEAPTVDLEAVATELADVEIALARLDNGSYWTDEVTGEPLPDELLERSPVTRRLPEA